MNFWHHSWLWFWPLWAYCGASTYAYEADQYLNRTVHVPDSLTMMDTRVNAALLDIAAGWQGARSDARFARAVYRKLGGLHWADRIERWANANPAVAKYPQTRFRNIYTGMPFWATRVNFFFGVARSIRIGGVMVGTDKFGHFFSQGLKYYNRQQRGWREERIWARGALAERWIFGRLTTGTYANADLVANFEGMRFYRSLFENEVVAGKAAVVSWTSDGPVISRPFTWSDHINDYWDEALNPGWMVDSLEKRLRLKVTAACTQARESPDAYRSEQDAALWARYSGIGLIDARHMQFEAVCSLGTKSG